MKCHKDDLKAKASFLNLSSPSPSTSSGLSTTSFPDDVGPFADVLLFSQEGGSVAVPVHKAILVSKSPVFKAMLENQMEESLSGTIKIGDVSYDILGVFVNYLYTSKVDVLDYESACELLILAEKYQVQHLKDCCQKLLVSHLNWDNSLTIYALAHRHNAKDVIDASLSLITDNMDKITAREEYEEMKKKDPQLVFEIYEAHLSKHLLAKEAAAAAVEKKEKDSSQVVKEFDDYFLVCQRF